MGVNLKRPHLSDNGRGVNHANSREEGVESDSEFHPMTMPELLRWFRFLSARLRHVKILNGDWQRACTSGASLNLTVRMGGVCGVFLDPPYADTAERDSNLYAHDDLDVAHAVRKWAIEHGDDRRYRIAMAGFQGEHGDAFQLAGWREIEWFKAGFLKGGMANQGKGGHAQGRERLWLSPHCLGTVKGASQIDLFGCVAP